MLAHQGYGLVFVLFSSQGTNLSGGPDGIRTRDLRDANAALYQLSYRPAMLFQAARLDIERLLKQGLLSSLR